MKPGVNNPCPCGSGKKYKKCCMNKPKDDSEDVAKQDWRLRAIAALGKPFRSPLTGEISPIGTAVIQSTAVEASEERFSVGVPSAPALFLDLSKKAYIEATALKSTPNFFLRQPGKSKSIESKLFFDFLEQMMASIVFAYTSVESFANLAIPSDYVHKEKRKDGRCIEEYNKEQIERYFNLEKKLDLLLQFLTTPGIKSPKGTDLWIRFQKLEKLRDRIIHLKTSDTQAADPKNPVPKSIWQELVQMPETYHSVYDLFNHYSGNKPPRWLWKFNEI